MSVSASMRRSTLVAAVVGVVLSATACGALADDTAATVMGRDVPTSLVDAMTADEAFAEALGFKAPTGEGVLPGTSARTVLGFILEAEALFAEAERQELSVEPVAEEVLAEQLSGAGVSPDQLDPVTRTFARRYLGASEALASAAQDPEPPTEAELVDLYERTPDLWDRTCVDVLSATAEQADAIEAAIAAEPDGELAAVVEVVPEARMEVDSAESCLAAQQLAGTPEAFGDALADAPEGEVVGPVEIEGPQGAALIWFEVQSSGRLSFEEAREEVKAIAEASPLALDILRTAEINPRYGGGVELEPASSPDGSTRLIARVTRPTAPEPVLDTLAPDGAPATP